MPFVLDADAEIQKHCTAAKTFSRCKVIQLAATGMAVAGSLDAAATPRSETVADVDQQPEPGFNDDANTADILVETLIAWGATHVFGVVGDDIDAIVEALRRRRDRTLWRPILPSRPDGWASASARRDRGAIHLLNGLCDARFDGAPVVALTGTTFHDLIGVRYQQSVDTVRLMQEVALYNIEVSGPEHAILVGNRACCAALGERGAAHLTIAKDVQMMERSADKRSMRNPGAHVIFLAPAISVPPAISWMPRRVS